MHPHQNTERTHFHFSFLRDIKVHGIYYTSLARYLECYPYMKKSHSYDFYTVLLFTSGKGTLKINNDTYKVQPQTVCLIAPDQLHSFEDIEDANGILFFFCQDFYVEEFSFVRLLNVFSYTSRVDKNSGNPTINLSEKEFTPIFSMLNTIHQEYKSHTNGNNSPLIIRSLLNIMLLKLAELYEAKTEKTKKSDSIMVHSLAHLVDSYFIQEQQLGFYTSAFNVTERQLNDICNKHFNCGLKKILQDRLMQEARKLLLSSEFSVAEVAYKLNFEDNSYFNKVFRKKIGLTPRKFREMHKRLLP